MGGFGKPLSRLGKEGRGEALYLQIGVLVGVFLGNGSVSDMYVM